MSYQEFEQCQLGKTYFLSCGVRGDSHIFDSAAICTQVLDLMRFYQFERSVHFKHVHVSCQAKVFAYCVEPAGLTVLAKQEAENGIHFFMFHVLEAITSYYGALFKAPRAHFGMPVVTEVLNDTELRAALRYVNSMPIRQHSVRDGLRNESYPWSSYQEILRPGRSHGVMSEDVWIPFGGPDALREFIRTGRA